MTADKDRINKIEIAEDEKIERKKFLDVFAKIIRVATTAPLISLVLFTVLYFKISGLATPSDYIMTVLFYTVLPLCAYPLQPILPHFKNDGRHGQRTLAMIMAYAGYLLSFLYGFVAGVSRLLFILYLTYVISCTLLLVTDKLFGFHASGHACGLCGPIAELVYFTGWYSLAVGALVFALVLWSSVRMKRHTVAQFLAGGAVSVTVFLLLAALVI